MFFLLLIYCLSNITLSIICIALRSHFLIPKRIVFGISPSDSVVFPFLNSRSVSFSTMNLDFTGAWVTASRYISLKEFTFLNFVFGAFTGAMTWYFFIKLSANFGRSFFGSIFCMLSPLFGISLIKL